MYREIIFENKIRLNKNNYVIKIMKNKYMKYLIKKNYIEFFDKIEYFFIVKIRVNLYIRNMLWIFLFF